MAHRTADVHDVVAANLPDYRIGAVVPIGAGLDHRAYEVNGELIVRFSNEPDPARRAALVDHEACLLTAVAEVAPVPVPEISFVAVAQGCLAYAKLRGVPLLDLPRHQRADHTMSIAATLGELLTALHAALPATLHANPVDAWSDLVDSDHQPLAEWRREAEETYLALAGQIPVVRPRAHRHAHRRAVETFLAARPPHDEYRPVFSHNDLGIEHVLVDPVTWTVTGVIDWSDAAIVDPAYDFGLLYRDLGPAALNAAIHHYRADVNDVPALRERAVFYARCKVFEDLAFGLDNGRDTYVDKCLDAMEWLFPA
jgi:aminoglycoside phosphotransferase (APT) family kinase protein